MLDPVKTLRYLDPGTGSMALQYLAALLLTAILVIKAYFKKIKRKVKRVFQIV